ncbi:Uncharacterized protein APZ42_026655 [Daphnia magna]|uniref:Uncharacterized protein n=1 Tax=Daphnia magna TaxID=35525 RepID=A0A162ECW4_9CRUS|nr:Uncharacterized protein APZ42_026655 [Daphnia magna]
MDNLYKFKLYLFWSVLLHSLHVLVPHAGKDITQRSWTLGSYQSCLYIYTIHSLIYENT